MNRPAPSEHAIFKAGPATTARAVALLRAGQPLGLPTETVYGLAADACDDRAVARIFEMKGRPTFNPLIIHVADMAQAEALVELTPLARRIAARFWPGPLTLVLPRRTGCPVSLLASAGLDTLAIRMPAHPAARDILRAFGGPLAAPSANRSGHVSPTTARHVIEELPVAMVVDGGPCTVGLESTIVGFDGERPVLLRPGGIAAEDIKELAGVALLRHAPEQGVTAPGQLSSHYAPDAALRLDARDVRSGEALLAFGAPLPGAQVTLNLSPSGDPAEAAANLFAMLRALDHPGVTAIAVMPIPETGLGLAVNDRLRRAAAPREGRP
ncbi:L-threonylcarbamoyladenylate synthase [Emcibacter sp. SYSU 3D8]|uniref:L-threonylcarbamoyladenylate synthase n=1 Tax=Emcibacter sp. SYSU 3D8 TaxID=3133969 RepID=UPI0031FE7125